MTKKLYTVNVVDDEGIFSSQTMRLDDEGLQTLSRGIAVALAASLDLWAGQPWTKDETIDAYSDVLQDWKKYELIQQTVETTNDLELFEFMKSELEVIEEDRIYESGDDVELAPEVAAQYRADRKNDDVPEST